MRTADEVLAVLRDPAIPFSSEQIRQSWDLLKWRHSNAVQQAACTFRFGDKVEFTHNGDVKRGMVTKVNRKTVSVNVNGATWRCGPTLLRKVS